MNIHSVHLSKVNGPGLRYVIWTQGCSKGCVGCFNPLTWSFESNKILTPFQIFEDIKNFEDIDGVTISGGDPLEQEDILDLLMLLWSLNLRKGIILYTGYSLDEINKNSYLRKCLSYIDVLIDEKFEEDKKTYIGPAGSMNQNVLYFSSKISEEEMKMDQGVEILLDGNNVSVTGFPHLDRKVLKNFGVILK